MKTLVLVDVRGLRYGARREFGGNAYVDYVKLRPLLGLTERDTLVACVTSYSSPERAPEDERFVQFLQANGWHVRRKFDGGPWPDMEALAGSEEYDRLCVVSGSGASLGAVEAAQSRGKEVVVASFRGDLHPGLRARANAVITLDAAALRMRE